MNHFLCKSIQVFINKKNEEMKRNVRFLVRDLVIGIVILLLLGFGNIMKATEKEKSEYPSTPRLSTELEELISGSVSNEKIDLDLFVMSYCPYGIETELALIPYVKENQDKINLNIYYIADETEDGSFVSLHGDIEVEEDIRQLIIKRLYPEKYLDYIFRRGERFYDADWTAVAEEFNIDVDKVGYLLDKEESFELLRNNIKLSVFKKIDFSPSVYVNGKKYMEGTIIRMSKGKQRGCSSSELDEERCMLVRPTKWIYISENNHCKKVKKRTYHKCTKTDGGKKWLDTGKDCTSTISHQSTQGIKYDSDCCSCDSENGLIPVQSPNTNTPCKHCDNCKVIVARKTTSTGDCTECDGKGNEVYKEDGIPCDDGDPCTTNDRCINGVCTGDPVTSSEDPNCGGK